MFIATSENFILFAALLAVAGFAVAGTVRWLAGRGWWQARPETLARIYAAAVALPPLLSAWLVAAALLPEWWLGEAAFDAAHPAPLHPAHLFGELTARLEPELAYVTLALAVVTALFAAIISIRVWLRLNRIIRWLDANALPPSPEQLSILNSMTAKHGLPAGLVLSDASFSFVWGFRRSRLVLSSGLLHALTPAELDGVLAHEAAHHSRRDNLGKLVLALCSYASLAFPLLRLVRHWHAEQVELLCDEVGAANTAAPLDIADALVKLRRQTVVLAPVSVSSFFPLSPPSLERRVQRLVELSDAPPTVARAAALAQSHSRRAIGVAACAGLFLLTLPFLAPLAVHAAAEALIHIFK